MCRSLHTQILLIRVLAYIIVKQHPANDTYDRRMLQFG